MGLKCLLGHDFGPSVVDREHEEDGNEMVVTEREVRRCRRCDEEQVLSESTEVRAIRSESEVGQRRRDTEAVVPAEETEGVVDPDRADLSPDVAAPGERVDDAAAAEGSDTSLIDRAEEGFDDAGTTPTEEDAVILDDDTPERRYGEWPDSGDVGDPATPGPADGSSGESGANPGGTEDMGGTADASAAADEDDVETATDTVTDSDDDADTVTDSDVATDTNATDDDGHSVAETAAEEDAELLGGGPDAAESDTDPTGAGDDAAGTGDAWPAREGEGEDEGFSAAGATPGGPGIAYGAELAPRSTNGESHDDGYATSYQGATVEDRDGDGTIVSARSTDATEPAPGVETEYYCPNCGHARPLDSSLRPGDICPECQRGYIAERER